MQPPAVQPAWTTCSNAGQHVGNVLVYTNCFHRPLPTPQVNYYLALRSSQFVGNSVSVFSALTIMERWRRGAYAAYYNGGNIPLETVMPFYP